jgi:heat shock protein HslJ
MKLHGSLAGFGKNARVVLGLDLGLAILALICAGVVHADDAKLVRLAHEPLQDVNWVFAETPGESGVLPEGGRMMMLNFNSHDKQLRGSGPCNTLTATYEYGHELLTLGPINATQLTCGFEKEEKAFISTLASTKAYRIEGNHLILLDGEGKITMRFAGSAIDPGGVEKTPLVSEAH